MFELVFLGTSASAPSVHRGMPAMAVLAGEHRYLVDCGEGTQRQILRSGLGFKKLNRILLTHAHLDHILGLGGLVSSFTHFDSVDFIEIYGGKPALERIDALLFQVVLRGERQPTPIHLIDVVPGQLLDAKAYEVFAFGVTHRGWGNFGYTFQERTHRPFLIEKAEALGVPAGPERGLLVRGETIMLAGGRVIAPEDVLGADVPGTKLVIIGDTGRTDNLLEQVRGADTLVIEGTFLEDNAEEARAFGHLTAAKAATLARDAGVRSLILTHISRRYRERDVIHEARSVFPEAYVARDFDHFRIKRGEGATKVDPFPAHDPEAEE